MKYIDLTHPFTNDMPVSEYDNKPRLETVKTIDEDGYGDVKLETTMHIGTHMDAPSHMIESNVKVADIPLDHLIGSAVVIDIRSVDVVEYKREYENYIQQDDIVLLYSGKDKQYKESNYFTEYPVLSEQFCKLLITKKVKLIGLDFYSPDRYPFAIHKSLLQSDIYIAENLCNIEQLLGYKDVKIYIIPMKITAEGAFIRAFAEVQ